MVTIFCTTRQGDRCAVVVTAWTVRHSLRPKCPMTGSCWTRYIAPCMFEPPPMGPAPKPRCASFRRTPQYLKWSIRSIRQHTPMEQFAADGVAEQAVAVSIVHSKAAACVDALRGCHAVNRPLRSSEGAAVEHRISGGGSSRRARTMPRGQGSRRRPPDPPPPQALRNSVQRLTR